MASRLDPYGHHRQSRFGGLGRMARGRGVFAAAAAVGVVVAFTGIVWYAYSQGVKTGSERVAPLIMAEEGPTRVRPESPGGMDVPHQDKLIYQQFSPGQVEPQVERLLPPPEDPLPRPAAPETEIASIEELLARQDLEESVGEPVPEVDLGEAPTSFPDLESEDATQPATPGVTPDAPSGQPSATQAPQPSPDPQPVPQPQPQRQAQLAPPPQSRPLAQPAPQPQPSTESRASRPTQLVPPAGSSAQAAPQPQQTQTARLPAAPPPAASGGRYRVQLLAVRSEEAAMQEWSRLRSRHGDVLGALGSNVVRIDLGGDRGVFYRLQAGPLGDETSARQVCSELGRRDVECLVVGP